MSNMPSDFRIWEDRDEGYLWVVTNYLFHEPLYGFYVFNIELFADGDIQGTLLTVPINMNGPYDTYEQGIESVKTILRDLHSDGKLG